MDDLDHAILRELGSGQVLLWGGQDPRVCATDLAERLRVDRGTVRLRLKSWEKEGFLLGFSNLPNPSLFGMETWTVGVSVPDPARKAAVMEHLALLDGVLSAMEHVGEWIGVAFVSESRESVKRRAAIFSRIPGVEAMEPPMRWRAPESPLRPTPLEWRILAALRRESGRERIGELARSVGVSANTFRSHYESIVGRGAVWSVPSLDFTKYRGAVLARFILTLEKDAQPGDVLSAFRKIAPGAMPQPTPETGGGVRLLSVHAQTDSLGALEDLTIDARRLAGVADAEILHPKRFLVFGSWLDERVELAGANVRK